MKTIKVCDDLIELKAILGEKIYLSDLDEFSGGDISILHNTVFNKSVTGIGGTTLALKSKESIIILMPFISVVDNKHGVVDDMFTVKGGVTVASIVRYLKNNKRRKIVSTFDGFDKIVRAYELSGIDIYKDFLLVDEWQVLFQQYGFRTEVVNYLLRESVKFEKKCFMTATPIKRDYWFDELLGLEELVLEYDIEPIVLRHYKSRNIIDEAVAIIRNQSADNNLHFFINSVDTIKSIAKTMNLPSGDVRVICSRQERNKAKLNEYKIEGTRDPVKKINFYTSTCFEGCDIFDKKGKVFVLCDGAKAHTLVDIATTLPQIAGRIRDIEDTSVNLVYSSTRYIDISQEEFDEAIRKNIEVADDIIRGVTTEEAVKALDMDYINSRYLKVEDGKLRHDKIFLYVDKANFEMARDYSYRANITAKMRGNFNPVKVNKPWAEEIEVVESEKVQKLSFKEQCQHYSEALKGNINYLSEYPKIVIDAVEKLGIQRLEDINYHRGDASKALIGMMDTSDEVKIMKMLNLRNSKFYSSSFLKDKFDNIYSSLDINATAKATDIKRFYDVKSTVRKIKGSPVRGFMVILPKISVSK